MRYSIQPLINGQFQLIDNESGKLIGEPIGSLSEATAAQQNAEAMAMQERISTCQRGQCGI